MTYGRSPPAQAAALAEAVGNLSMPSRGAACLSTDDILELLLGVLSETRRDEALAHVGKCEDCRVLFQSAAQAIEDTRPVSSTPRSGVFAPGTLVANRYQVERFLASGGMGEVYAVQDNVLNERVALKTVRGHSDDVDAKSIARLKSEALLSRRIGHPNTCRIFEFGEHETATGWPVYFLTMELVEGETLRARLRRDGSLPLEHIEMVARQVLGGLAEAHGLGIVHRDLKSDNIMLREPPPGAPSIDAVVMDFGLALRVDAAERLTSDSHALVGSAAYMSPEQVEGDKLTASTDVYAFGVILFEMLTGELPFRAATPVATALKRLHQDPPLPSSLRDTLDPRWDILVRRCLERDVQRRFPSAREVLVALDGSSHPEPVAPPRRRGAILWASLALAVLLSGGGLVWLAERSLTTPPPPSTLGSVAESPASSPGPLPTASGSSASASEAAEALTPPPPSSVAASADAVVPATNAAPASDGTRGAAPGAPPKARQRTSVPQIKPRPPSRPGPASAATPAPAVVPEPPVPAAPNAASTAPEPSPALALPAPRSPLEPLPLDPEFPE